MAELELNLIGEIQAKIVLVVERNMRVGRILIGPGTMATLMHQLSKFWETFAPEDLKRVFFGIPVIVVRDVRHFEVSIE